MTSPRPGSAALACWLALAALISAGCGGPAAPPPSPVTPSPGQPKAGDGNFRHEIARDADYYLTAPGKGAAPDGQLKQGTRVRLVAAEGRFLLVATAKQQELFVRAGDVAPVAMESDRWRNVPPYHPAEP